ncbi:phenylalanine-tRNA ligase [Tieghemostelium lacteum]|uniref:phenylalanine--tRNA ligase n=1 Tax=Tieghemostelium lacteum TaxID=361077 RepID=A0A152A6J8_TIELA|nr:phenylalanine-tRNA ligase [Tieghemostelium lacteum]|eukprot:KYR01852.1 phenylalanine-tRNA ligase [Tieghemostelium lacteum]
MALKEKQDDKINTDSNLSDDIIYKIDIPANRYDLLCLEGISRALNVYNGKIPIVKYSITPPPNGVYQKLIVQKEVDQVRPIIVCGVLRDITFNQDTYQSFIDLQDKLHQNVCRKRTLVSIGTHDLDTIKGPFTYKALPPKDIKFVPLSQTKEFNAEELFKHYDETKSHLKPYLPIIKDSPVYPVIYDSNGVVLSLPPIINGEHSKITLNTKNVFIEVTATDKTKANIVLNTMLTMFSGYCKKPYTMEQVEVVDQHGKTHLYPQIDEKSIDASVEFINKSIGIDIKAKEMVEKLSRMSLESKVVDDSKIRVQIPVTRSDIIHECDIMEDVAVGYGFNNLKIELPKTLTSGRIQPINKLSELISQEVALAGYTEIMTFVLCHNKDNFESLKRKDDGSSVKIGNYLHEEFSEVRTNVISSLLKSVVTNQAAPLPIKLFEMTDVAVKGSLGNKDLSDPDSNNSDVGAYNKRVLGAIFANSSSKLEVIHGLLDKVMLSVSIPQVDATNSKGYELVHSNDAIFIPGMGTDILVNGKKVGIMGVVHPHVLKNYECPFPCSILEIEINLEFANNILNRVSSK